MLKNFTGTHDHKMDDKGRVSLPTEFRRVLAEMGSTGGLYIVPQLDDPRAHVFFTIDAYNTLVERHNAREYETERAQKIMDFKLITRAAQIQIDDVGRIVIAKPLRDKTGLKKDIRFVGAGSSFEVWRPEDYDAYTEEMLAGDAEESVDIDRRGLH